MNPFCAFDSDSKLRTYLIAGVDLQVLRRLSIVLIHVEFSERSIYFKHALTRSGKHQLRHESTT